VATRTPSGRSLSYIEGWHAIAEANRIFGFDGWHRETVQLQPVSERERTIGRGDYAKPGWGVSYIARVRVTVFVRNHNYSIIREGVGNGHGIDADLGLAHESAAKEAETDAMKRALMTFGNPFGLALYDKSQAQVTDDRNPTVNVNPAKDDPGGAHDVAALTAKWCDDRAKELDAIGKSGEPERLKLWHAKHSKALLRLKANYEAQYDRLMNLYNDVYSMLGKADGGALPITFAG
jgi:DNA recombination protein Rad52